MGQNVISVERVLEIIAAYGARPFGWPEDERDAAEALIEAEPTRFADALAQAQRLDEALAIEPIVDPSPMLADKILATAPTKSQTRIGWFADLRGALFPQKTRWPASAALASLAMGLVGGYAYASTGTVYDEADQALYTAFGYDAETSWTVEDVS
jgi:hypothetical protein